MQVRSKYIGKHRWTEEPIPAWLRAVRDGIGDALTYVVHSAIVRPQIFIAAVSDNRAIRSKQLYDIPRIFNVGRLSQV